MSGARLPVSADHVASTSAGAWNHIPGFGVGGGHGLDCPDVGAVAVIDNIEEPNIGNAIIAGAVLQGLDRAVRDMIDAISAGCN